MKIKKIVELKNDIEKMQSQLFLAISYANVAQSDAKITMTKEQANIMNFTLQKCKTIMDEIIDNAEVTII